MKDILALNKISPLVDQVLEGKFKLVNESKDPAGILVRSFAMHEYEPASSVLCVGRAGAGVNNIPLEPYAQKGIVVFNTPGANANAVKELVLAALFLCGRKLIPAINWAQGLTSDVAAQVEKGKAQFVGNEITGKKLAVYGLGAIGKLVAIGAAALGMNVEGYDPFCTDTTKQYLASNNVTVVSDFDLMVSTCDFFSLHVPYNDQTKGCINAKRLATMKDGVNIINCARGELVADEDIKAAIASGKVNRYVTDFPNEAVLGNENIITFPHLGASTPEAEDNCAVMAGSQMVDFIENGTIKNSVNFPAIELEKSGKQRLVLLLNLDADFDKLAKEVEKLGKITGSACQKGKTKSAALFDLADTVDAKVAETLQSLDCVIRARLI